MMLIRSTGKRVVARQPLLLAAVLMLLLPGCDSVESLEREGSVYLANGDRISAAITFRALLARDPKHAEAAFQLGKILADSSILPEAESFLRQAIDLGKPAVDVIPVLGPVLLDLDKSKELLQLLEPDPKRPQPTDAKTLAEFAVLRGLAYLAERDLTSANTQFQLAMGASPDKARLGLARLALARKDERQRAESLIAEVLASNPRSAEAHLALAELRRTAGELEQALPEYVEAAKLEPSNVNLALLQGIALVSADRIADARPVLERASKMAPAGPLLNFAQGLIECKEKRYQTCSQYLQKVLDVLPQYAPALLVSGQLSYATGELEQAQTALVRYLTRYPTDTNARKLLAATLLAKNYGQAALNVLRPLLAGEVEDPQLLGLAGQAMLQLGDVQEARETLAKAVKLAPQDVEFRTALAMTHLASGMRERAEADFRAAIAMNPPNTKADYGLIMMLVADKRIEKAREAALAVERRLPSNPETHMLKGVVMRAAGDASGARLAFQRATQLNTAYFPAVQELAGMDLDEGKPDSARKRISEVLNKNPTHLEALLSMAQLEFKAGQRAEGLKWARQAADAHPESITALLMIAEAQVGAGELKESVQSAKQALRLRPRDPKVLKTLGTVQMAAKDYSGAITTFSTLTMVQSGSVEAYLLLASANMANGDSRTATEVVRGALKRNPRSQDAKALLANILISNKKYGEALDLARQVQRDNPKSVVGFRLEGDILLAQGEGRGAVKAFEAAAKLEPSGQMLTNVHRALSVASPDQAREAPLEEWVQKNPDDVATRTYLAEALSAKGRYKEAIPHYVELDRRKPQDARTLNNLAWSLHAVGDGAAFDFAERAYQLTPGEPAVLDTFGWILVSRGKLHEGIQMLLKAVALDGENREIRYHLAQALVQAGDKTRARAELRNILGAGKAFPHSDDAQALLKSLGP